MLSCEFTAERNSICTVSLCSFISLGRGPVAAHLKGPSAHTTLAPWCMLS